MSIEQTGINRQERNRDSFEQQEQANGLDMEGEQ